MEQLFNLYSSTLSANYTAGGGIIFVTSGSGLPSTGVFALTVLDQTTLSVKVIFRAHYLGGTAVAVTPEGGDQNCVAGDIVVGSMLTARSMLAIQNDWMGMGPTSNLPGTTGRASGQRYKVTDGNFEYVFDDGTENSPATSALWVPYFRGIQTVIPSQSFSWINQSGASVAVQNDGSIYLAGTANSGTNLQCRIFTAPGTPYKYKFIFTPILPDAHFAHAGILFSDGTKLSEVDLLVDNAVVGTTGIWTHFTAAHYSDVNTNSGALSLTKGWQAPSGQPLVLGLSDDGTNRKFFYYPDGYTEIQLFSEGRTNFLTASEVGFFYDDNGANIGGGIIVHGIQRTV